MLEFSQLANNPDKIPLDFHCHSTYSDGALNVPTLLDEAKKNGCQHLALTDHDTIDGIPEAKAYAEKIGINLIPGVEISVSLDNGAVIHVVGLNINDNTKEIAANLDKIRGTRIERGRQIAAKLEKCGISGAFEGAMKYCSDPNALSRTHFARFLVENGHVKPGKAFDKYLATGKPAYVKQEWASLKDSIDWINNSGGIAVIAHPVRYKFTRTKLLALIEQFKSLGGRGIEVLSSSHSKDDAINIAKIAKDTGLLASMGSDFHNFGVKHVTTPVGVNYHLPPICGEPIYNYL